ncbi:hypothetical protein Mapa_010880 [Marchantia paleacea]|nr:hypothetical protein Mapa_010880 [Marchantia paleacea]
MEYMAGQNVRVVKMRLDCVFLITLLLAAASSAAAARLGEMHPLNEMAGTDVVAKKLVTEDDDCDIVCTCIGCAACFCPPGATHGVLMPKKLF